MAKQFAKKDPFECLDQEYKDTIANLPTEGIKVHVANIALELDCLMEAKKNDQDLHEKTEVAKDAGAVYREGKKGANLRIRYANNIIEGRGK